MADLITIEGVFESHFPDYIVYVTYSEKTEHVVDIKDTGCIFESPVVNPGFDIINPNNTRFCLVQIDNRLLPKKKDGQCDCAFIYDESINLIEFKTETFTDKLDTAKKRYNKAIKQLHSTIRRFRRAGLNLTTLAANVESYVCMNQTFPRILSFEMSESINFIRSTKIKLIFDNKKIIT